MHEKDEDDRLKKTTGEFDLVGQCDMWHLIEGADVHSRACLDPPRAGAMARNRYEGCLMWSHRPTCPMLRGSRAEHRCAVDGPGRLRSVSAVAPLPGGRIERLQA